MTEAIGATILWNFEIQTDRKIKSYRRDITTKDNERKLNLLIDILVSIDDKISVKE